MANIYSSHGSGPGCLAFVINDSGKVLDTTLEDSWDRPIPARFDADEFRQTYGTKLDEHIDIMDIGYWNPDREYLEACPNFRLEALQQIASRATPG